MHPYIPNILAALFTGLLTLQLSGQTVQFAVIENCESKDYEDISYQEVQNGLINEGVTDGCVDIVVQLDRDTEDIIMNISHVFHEPVEAHIIEGSGTILRLDSERYLTYHLTGDADTKAKIRIRPSLSAYVPIAFYDIEEYQRQEGNNMLGIGLYFGFVFAMFLLNLILYAYFKDWVFLIYGLAMIFISLNIWHNDGMIGYYGGTFHAGTMISTLGHWIVPVLFVILNDIYVDLNRYLPKIKYALAISVFLITIAVIMYLATGLNWYGAYVDISAIITLLILFFGTVWIMPISKLAQVFFLAYVFILLCTIDIYIPKLFGINVLNVTHGQVKLGGIIEMVVFLFAIIYRMNKLKEENLHYQSEVKRILSELSSIQDSTKHTVQQQLNSMGLTARQLQILEFLQKGSTNKEIAASMNISVNTVKYHTKNIYEKMGVSGRIEVLVVES